MQFLLIYYDAAGAEVGRQTIEPGMRFPCLPVPDATEAELILTLAENR